MKKRWRAPLKGVISSCKSLLHLTYINTEFSTRYFGHGGGEQFIRSQKIKHLPQCAAAMLWGCSSGAMRDMGDFDPIGTPYHYMLAGW